jgi:hypothetical protein
MASGVAVGLRKSQVVARQFCSKCGFSKDHMRLLVWTEESGNPDTYIKAESWICCYCDNLLQKRSEEQRPTQQGKVVKRLMKLAGDYEQICSSELLVENNSVTLKLRFYPWSVMQSAQRVEQSKETGFYRLGDLWRLQQHGLFKELLERGGTNGGD